MWHFVPDEWKPKLREYIRQYSGEERDHLLCYDFDGCQVVQVNFEDGSSATFKYAFVLFRDTEDRCMVFTEHCGYHRFPVAKSDVTIMRIVEPPDALDLSKLTEEPTE